MKLRIKGNSIRIRLLRSEVEKLAAAGRVSEEMRFGIRSGDVFRYTVMSSAEAQAITVAFVPGEIVVSIPDVVVSDWSTGGVVSIEAEQAIDETGGKLDILIEKDFVCVGRPDDPDRADAFPHPKMP